MNEKITEEKEIYLEKNGNFKTHNFLSLLQEFFDSGDLDINDLPEDGLIEGISEEVHNIIIAKIVEKYQLFLEEDYSNLTLLYNDKGVLCAFSINHFIEETVEVYLSDSLEELVVILKKLGFFSKKDLASEDSIKAWATDISNTRFIKESFSDIPTIDFTDFFPKLELINRKITYRGGVVFGAPGTGKTVLLMQLAKSIFDTYEKNWETKNYEDFKIVNPVYSYSFAELMKNMDNRFYQLLICDDALVLQSKNVCNNAATALSRIRHIYEEKNSTQQATIQLIFVAQEIFELTKALRAQLHYQIYKSLSINDYNQRVVRDRLGIDGAIELLNITKRILKGDDSAMCESVVRILGEEAGKVVMPEYDQKEYDLVFSKFRVIDPFISRDVVGVSRRHIPVSKEWFNFLQLFIEEIDRADLNHVLSHYKISTEYEFWSDRIQRWFEYYFEGKEYEEIDSLHSDSATNIYLVAVRKFLICAEMNHVKERASEKFVAERITEAIKELIFLAETEENSSVKTKPPFSFSSGGVFSFEDFSFLQGCSDHRKGSMSNDLCIHFRGKHLLSINVKFTLKTPDKFLTCSPEKDFRPAAICNINVDYSKANRGVWVAFQILKEEEEGLRLKNMEVIAGEGKEIWLKIAEKILERTEGVWFLFE